MCGREERDEIVAEMRRLMVVVSFVSGRFERRGVFMEVMMYKLGRIVVGGGEISRAFSALGVEEEVRGFFCHGGDSGGDDDNTVVTVV